MIDARPKSVALLQSRAGEGFLLGYAIRNFLPHKLRAASESRAAAGWTAENEPFVIDAEDTPRRGRFASGLRVDYPGGVHDPSPDRACQRSRDRPRDPGSCGSGIRVGIVRSQDNTMESAASTLGVDYALVSDGKFAGDRFPVTRSSSTSARTCSAMRSGKTMQGF